MAELVHITVQKRGPSNFVVVQNSPLFGSKEISSHADKTTANAAATAAAGTAETAYLSKNIAVALSTLP